MMDIGGPIFSRIFVIPWIVFPGDMMGSTLYFLGMRHTHPPYSQVRYILFRETLLLMRLPLSCPTAT